MTHAVEVIKLNLEMCLLVQIDPVFEEAVDTSEQVAQELKTLLRIQNKLAKENHLFPKTGILHFLASFNQLNEIEKALAQQLMGETSI